MSDPRRPGPPPQAPYPSFEERAYGATDRLQPQPTLHAPPRGGPGYPNQPRRPRRWGRLIFVVVLGLFAVITAAAIFLITNPPTELIRAQLIDHIKARTGRTLEIAGPTKFTVIPALGVSMKDVTLSQPPGLKGPPFAKMAGLDVSVRLLPLLKREVAIDQLVLHQPIIDLRVDKSGRASWDFAEIKTRASRVRIAQAGGVASDAPGGLPDDARQFLENASDARKSAAAPSRAALTQLQFGDVRIVNGTVKYNDARSGTKHFADAVNVRLRLDHIAAPLQAKGNVRWKKETLDFSSTLTSVSKILADQPAALLFTLNSKPLNSRYDGTIQLGQNVQAKGAVAASTPSLRRLARWLGTELPPAPGYGAMQITGILESRGTTHKISSAKFDLDNQLAQGLIVVTTGGARPAVNADLKISELNLNNYMSNGTTPPPQRRAPTKTPTQPNKAKPGSIEDLLNETGTRVRGYSARAGWSRDPIGTAFLGAADVKAKLLIGRLLVQNLKIGQSDLNVQLKNKVLQTTINEIALYSGRGTGTLVGRDAGGGALNIKSNLSLTGVEARNFLRDAAGQDWLSGKGNVKLNVTGQGASQYQIVSSLNGSANIAFEDGAIVGVNIPQMIRNISRGNLAGLSNTSPTSKTDFSSLTATWAIQNGIATNRDLRLLSPLMRVGGEGSAALPAQTIDYILRPKLVASLEGQGADATGSGLEIPVRISGPWAKPRIQPEVGDILANPDKAIDTIKKIGEQFKGKDANEIIDGLLGGGNSSGTGDKKPNSAGDLLDRFLR